MIFAALYQPQIHLTPTQTRLIPSFVWDHAFRRLQYPQSPSPLYPPSLPGEPAGVALSGDLRDDLADDALLESVGAVSEVA